MTPYNIRPFRLLTDRFRNLFSVFAALRHEINVSVFIFSARGEHWGQTLSECACELSQPVPSLPLPATKCCLYVSLKHLRPAWAGKRRGEEKWAQSSSLNQGIWGESKRSTPNGIYDSCVHVCVLGKAGDAVWAHSSKRFFLLFFLFFFFSFLSFILSFFLPCRLSPFRWVDFCLYLLLLCVSQRARP